MKPANFKLETLGPRNLAAVGHQRIWIKALVSFPKSVTMNEGGSSPLSFVGWSPRETLGAVFSLILAHKPTKNTNTNKWLISKRISLNFIEG